MLIIALVLALIGLVALVFAVVTSNELVAWVCIGASVLGVVMLIMHRLRARQHGGAGTADHDAAHDQAETGADSDEDSYVDYPEEVPEGGQESAESTGSEATEQSK